MKAHAQSMGTRIALIFAVAITWSSTCLASTDTITIAGQLQVGSNYTDFGNLAGTVFTPAPGYGAFQVTAVDAVGALTTAGVTVNETGGVQSLNEPPGTVTLPGPFITFSAGASNIQLWATNIPAGATAGPFTLSNVSGGVLAQFAVNGYVFNTTSGAQTGLFTSIFDVAFPGATTSTIFNNLPINGGFCAVISTGTAAATPCNPFPAAPSAPEPFSAYLMGAGFLIVAFLVYGMKKASSSRAAISESSASSAA